MNKLIIVGFLLAAAWTDASAQQTYEMRCRGGKFLSLTTPSVPWAIDATGKSKVVMTLKFAGGPQRAKIGSDGTRLNPGQCSWVDRDLRAGEPTEIRFDLLKNSFERQRYVQGFVKSAAEIDRGTELYPDAESLPGYLASPDHYWSFRVYHTGKGFIQATRSDVFKPVLQRRGVDTLPKKF